MKQKQSSDKPPTNAAPADEFPRIFTRLSEEGLNLTAKLMLAKMRAHKPGDPLPETP